MWFHGFIGETLGDFRGTPVSQTGCCCARISTKDRKWGSNSLTNATHNTRSDEFSHQRLGFYDQTQGFRVSSITDLEDNQRTRPIPRMPSSKITSQKGKSSMCRSFSRTGIPWISTSTLVYWKIFGRTGWSLQNLNKTMHHQCAHLHPPVLPIRFQPVPKHRRRPMKNEEYCDYGFPRVSKRGGARTKFQEKNRGWVFFQ